MQLQWQLSISKCNLYTTIYNLKVTSVGIAIKKSTSKWGAIFKLDIQINQHVEFGDRIMHIHISMYINFLINDCTLQSHIEHRTSRLAVDYWTSLFLYPFPHRISNIAYRTLWTNVITRGGVNNPTYIVSFCFYLITGGVNPLAGILKRGERNCV